MNIEVSQTTKTISFWLTRAERENRHVRLLLEAQYGRIKKHGYHAVVYLSGSEPLADLTASLLRQNLKIHHEGGSPL